MGVVLGESDSRRGAGSFRTAPVPIRERRMLAQPFGVRAARQVSGQARFFSEVTCAVGLASSPAVWVGAACGERREPAWGCMRSRQRKSVAVTPRAIGSRLAGPLRPCPQGLPGVGFLWL